MSQKVLRLITGSIVVITHLMAYIEFNQYYKASVLPTEWKGQFYLLLALSALLGISLTFCRRQTVRWMILFIQGTFLIVIGLPTGSFLGVEQTLLIPLIIETNTYAPLWRAVIYSLSMGLIIIIVHLMPIVVWGRPLPAALPQDLYSFGVVQMICIVLTVIVRFQQKNNVPVTDINRLFHEATLKLAQVNMQLQEYAITAEQEAIIKERKRLARDLHDILAYTLTNLIMMLEEAKDMAAQGKNSLPEHLDHACAQTKEGLADLRQALKALRADNFAVATGLTAIHQLVAAFNKATQITVELNTGNVPLNFGAAAEVAAYRLVQEGMTNALRHGRAKQIFISLTMIHDGISIHIKDDGIGSDLAQEGYGLLGMRERIESLGGKLEISSQLGAGFRLLAWIPIR